MAETETPKKGGKGKKEKKAKAPKPKKEKKPKAPKPKKEKKPKAPKPKKEKKPKAPKPKKEKKPKKGKGAGGEDGESAGKRGPNKKLLILLIGIVLLMGVAAFLVIKVFKLFPALVSEEDPAPAETVETGEGDEEPGGDETPGEDEEPGGDAESEGEPAGDETAPPEETEPAAEQKYPTEIHTQITNAQVMEFIESLSPSILGLEGEDMSDYEMFASDNVSIIDGIYCTQVRVYSKNPSAGTNDIEGIYFVSRGNQRRLYLYDEFTETVTEIPLH